MRRRVVEGSFAQGLPYEPDPIKRIGVYSRETANGDVVIDVEAILADLVAVAKLADSIGAGPGGLEGLIEDLRAMWPTIGAQVDDNPH
jgi:hypothetical protein